MHNSQISEHLQEIMIKLSKKNKSMHIQLIKKIDEILNSFDIDHYKNLKYKMKDSKRVHMGSFVLIFQYDKKGDTVKFDDFDHHDKVYKY